MECGLREAGQSLLLHNPRGFLAGLLYDLCLEGQIRELVAEDLAADGDPVITVEQLAGANLLHDQLELKLTLSLG